MAALPEAESLGRKVQFRGMPAMMALSFSNRACFIPDGRSPRLRPCALLVPVCGARGFAFGSCAFEGRGGGRLHA